MRQEPVNKEDIIGFDALYNSMQKCKNGVLWKDSAAAFWLRGVERTDSLSQSLKNGAYKAAPPKHFKITNPKPRDIASICFRDRVYQRSLNDNLVYPYMTNGFIYDNFACQKGKGTDPARERLKEFLRKYYRKHGSVGYVAQFDVSGYYPNMRHDKVDEMFKEKLPEWGYDMVETILHEQYDGKVGYNPGSQLVQIAGISLLNKLDHFIKERLHAKFYLRYMDDFLIISDDKEYLERCVLSIGEELGKLGFGFNQKKTKIFELKNGILFLGFIFNLTDTGKVYMKIDPKKVKAERKKLYRMVNKAVKDGTARESIDASYAAWRNHASKGNSQQLIQRMDKYYNDLWKGALENDVSKQAQNGVAGEGGT